MMEKWLIAGILYFCFLGSSLGFASDSSLSDVALRVNITTEKLILNCEVPAFGLQSTTNLYCPLVGMSPCFENCVRSCIVIRGRCIPLDELKTISCMRRQANDKIITTYILNAKDPRNRGKWYCVHGGKESSGFIIDEMLTPKIVTTTTTTTTTTATPTTTTTRRPSTSSFRKPAFPILTYEPHGKSPTETSPQSHEGQKVDFIKQLTRPDLIIALLSLLALSLIINLAFCIRCILVRRYIELQRDGYKESPCLAGCLCISRPEDTKPSLKYPRDCIYEEITAANHPIGLVRRPSNCSSTQRTFTTSLDGTGVMIDGRNSVLRRSSMPRSRTFPVKAIGVPASALQQRPSYIYVAAAENGMLLEPVLAASRLSQQQLYDDVACEDLQSLAASTSAIYARVQKTSQQLHDRRATHQNLERKLQLQCQLQEHVEGGEANEPQPYSHNRAPQPPRPGSLPSPLAEQNDERTSLTESPAPSTAVTRAERPGSAGTGNSNATCEHEEFEMRRSVSPYDASSDDYPGNNTRLELSKTLLQKADTLLREAGCLLD